MDTPAIMRKRADRRSRATSIQRGMLAVLLLTLASAAIGCVGSGGSNTSLAPGSDAAVANIVQPNSEGAVAMGQSVETPNGHEVTVRKAAWWRRHGGLLVHSDLDNLFWVVHIRACAPPSHTSPVLVFSDEYTLTLNDGDKLNPLVSGREPWFASGEVPPGRCRAGWLTYEVPNGASPVALQYGAHRFDVYAS